MRNQTPMLDRMAAHHIFMVRWMGNKFVVYEAAQNHFSTDLSPEDLIRLGAEMVSAGTQRIEGKTT